MRKRRKGYWVEGEEVGGMGGSRREEISRGARRSREEERGREDLKRERERGRRRKIAPDNSGKRKGGKEREAGERWKATGASREEGAATRASFRGLSLAEPWSQRP